MYLILKCLRENLEYKLVSFKDEQRLDLIDAASHVGL